LEDGTVLFMLNAIFRGIRFVILVLSGHQHVALENAALRQQLAVCKRGMKRPRLRRGDRLFWIGLKAIWKDWKCALVVIVRLETVISWQRKRFKRYWCRFGSAKIFSLSRSMWTTPLDAADAVPRLACPLSVLLNSLSFQEKKCEVG